MLRRRWELTIDAGDGNVKRDGQRDAKTGRQAIAALWDAWELGTAVTFKDIDNDTDPVTYVVAIVGMEEKGRQARGRRALGRVDGDARPRGELAGGGGVAGGFDLDALET